MVYGDSVGRHISTIDIHKVERTELDLVILQSTQNLTVALPKLSVLGLYLRLLVERSHRLAVWIVAAIVASSAITAFFVSIFRCSPASKAWIPSQPGTCISIMPFLVYCSASHTASNIAMIFLPLPMIWKLRVDRSKKVRLYFMFLLGTM